MTIPEPPAPPGCPPAIAFGLYVSAVVIYEPPPPPPPVPCRPASPIPEL